MLVINPPVFAHRGANRYAPENTLAAFFKAKALGVRWIEFDVMLSADDEVVVMHDDTLDRTTNGRGWVSDYPYSTLKKLDAGSWFHPTFSDQKILLLSDVIDFLRQEHMGANIEIKASLGKEQRTAQKVFSIVQSHWTQDMLPPLISSFSYEILETMRSLAPEMDLGFLMDQWISEWQSLCNALQCVALHVNEQIITPQKVKQIKAAGYAVFCYTVNDPLRARELFSWGVDAVYSDVPEIMLNLKE